VPHQWTIVKRDDSPDHVTVQQEDGHVFLLVSASTPSENGRHLGIHLPPTVAGELIGALCMNGADLTGLGAAGRTALINALRHAMPEESEYLIKVLEQVLGHDPACLMLAGHGGPCVIPDAEETR
jgi:hypothetical protein